MSKWLFESSEPLKPHWLATVSVYADDGFGNRMRKNKPARVGFVYENALDYSYGVPK